MQQEPLYMNENTPYTLASTMKCPNCGLDITTVADVSPNGTRTMHKSKVVICCACSAPSIVGDSGLEQLTKERFDQLDPRTQQAIRVSVEQIRRITAQSAENN